MDSTASSTTEWWRDRRWRCTSCQAEFVLDRPYRVTDMRGTVVLAAFRCPHCGGRNELTRRRLKLYEQGSA